MRLYTIDSLYTLGVSVSNGYTRHPTTQWSFSLVILIFQILIEKDRLRNFKQRKNVFVKLPANYIRRASGRIPSRLCPRDFVIKHFSFDNPLAAMTAFLTKGNISLKYFCWIVVYSLVRNLFAVCYYITKFYKKCDTFILTTT